MVGPQFSATPLFTGVTDGEVRWYVPVPSAKDKNGQEVPSEAWANALVLLDQSVNEKYKKEKYEGHWVNYYGPELLGPCNPSACIKRWRPTTWTCLRVSSRTKVIFVGERLETKPGDVRKVRISQPFLPPSRQQVLFRGWNPRHRVP